MCTKYEKQRFKTAADRCDRCKRLSCNKCYCWKVNDGEHLKETQDLIDSCIGEAVDAEFAKLDKIWDATVIDSDPNTARKEETPLHIDYDPQSPDQSRHFSRLLNQELKLRCEHDLEKLEHHMSGTLQERRMHLKHI